MSLLKQSIKIRKNELEQCIQYIEDMTKEAQERLNYFQKLILDNQIEIQKYQDEIEEITQFLGEKDGN